MRVALLAALKALGLQRFIRTKEEVDKDALLREPQVATGVEGVTVGCAGEFFTIKPFETQIEEELAA